MQRASSLVRIATALSFGVFGLSGCAAESVPEADADTPAGSVMRTPIEPRLTTFASVFELMDTISVEESDSVPVARLSGLDMSAAGDIAIADESEANVKVYTSDGRLKRVLGRKGGGPGEFRDPRYPRFGPDGSLYVAEGSGAVTHFDANGSFVRRLPLENTVFIASFDRLADGGYVATSVGTENALLRYDGDGKLQATYLAFAQPPVSDQPSEPLWQTVTQYLSTVRNDSAFVFATVSDSVWIVDLGSGSTSAAGIQVPGYVTPRLPEKGEQLRSTDRFAWIKAAHVAMVPLSANRALGVSFVQGILNYGDPTVFVLQRPSGEWLAFNDAPPILLLRDSLVLAIHRPNAERTTLARYRFRQ